MADEEKSNNGLQPVSVEGSKQKMLVELTKIGYVLQAYHDRKANLVLSEENLEEVQAFLTDGKTMKNLTEETHKVVKKPFWDSGKNCDSAKNEIISTIDLAYNPVNEWYQKICKEIDKRTRDEEARIANHERIVKQVEADVLEFSGKIAACTTRQQLNDIERIINLEKSPSRATKYGELHQKAIDRYDVVLLPILKDQKKQIEEKEALEKELAKVDDPAKHEEISKKIEQKENDILQNQVKVQEQAINQQSFSVPTHEMILPSVTKGGSSFICEIVDEKKAFQKQRHLLNIELKLKDAQKLASTLRAAGSFGESDELIVDGIKFKLERRFK